MNLESAGTSLFPSRGLPRWPAALAGFERETLGSGLRSSLRAGLTSGRVWEGSGWAPRARRRQVRGARPGGGRPNCSGSRREARGSRRAPAPEPDEPWQAPGQSAASRSPTSLAGRPLSPHSSQPRPGLGDEVRRMSPLSWLLLPTLCLQLTDAAPRRGAPAFADYELKPQVRRVPRGWAASRHLPDGYLLNPVKHRALGPRANSAGGTPRPTAELPCSRIPPRTS